MRHWRDVRFAAVALLGLVLVSCGGGNDIEQVVSQPTIAISPQSVSMTVGGRQSFTAIVQGASASSVTWSATGGAVTSSGQYTAPNTPGNYEVTVSLTADPTVSATASVTVDFSPVKAVTVIPSRPTVMISGVQVFTAHVSGGSTSDVDWSVEPTDGSGGTITVDGVYTAPPTVASDPITVVAVSRADPSKRATATVTVTAHVPFGVEIVDTSSGGQQSLESRMINGERRVFQAVVTGAQQVDVDWELIPAGSITPTADPLVVLVTAPEQAGAYELIATVTDRVTGATAPTASRTVNVWFVSVTVDPPTPTVPAVGALVFSATVTFDDGSGPMTFVRPEANAPNPDPHPIVWTVREGAGGTIDPNLGTYTAPRLGGLYHVVATHGEHTAKSATATINVSPASVSLSPEAAEVESGASILLTARVSNVAASAESTVCGGDCRDVTWSIQEGSAGGSLSQIAFTELDDGSPQATATYTAPTRVGARDFHVIATSVVDPTKRAAVTIRILGVWKAVAAGGHHTVAIKTDGTLWAWGDNTYGQIGNGQSGSGILQTKPTLLTVVDQSGAAVSFEAVAAGTFHTLAIGSDGSLWAWGRNDSGQLGDGGVASRNQPGLVDAGPWSVVSARGDHTVAIKTDGTLWAWGGNTYGQVGNGQSGDGIQQATPTRLAVTDQSGATLSFEAAAAGTFHSLAIATDGTLWAWGRNDSGQLGDNSETQRDVPTQIGIETDWIAIDGGAAHSAGVRGDRSNRAAGGTLWTWGDNGSDQLGDATGIGSWIPLQVGTATDWSNVYLGEHHTFAIAVDQITAQPTLWGWGHNVHGELGLGQTGVPQVADATELGTTISQTWLMADSGLHHSVMLTADGHLWTTGTNRYGEIGDGTIASKSTPVRAAGTSVGWQGAKLAAGDAFVMEPPTGTAFLETRFVHNAAIKITGQTADQPPIPYGTLWAWGNNEQGQLGDGTRADRDVPVQVGTVSTWSQIAVGALHTAALRTDGTLWTWGDNSKGQLGVGPQIDWTSSPTEVPKAAASDPWVGVAAGAFHTVAITRNGNLWAWGANGKGQLGRPTNPAAPSEFFPVLVNDPPQPVAWLRIAAAQDHTLAIKREFPLPGIAEFWLWAWGDNGLGQLGDGSFAIRSEPTKITLDGSAASLTPDWQSVFAGGQHSLGIKGAGELWGWGDNRSGQVGLAGQATLGAPAPVDLGMTWNALSGGDAHTAGVAANGALWTWGNNESGQLGYGTVDANIHLPGQVGSETLWSTVSAGYGHTIATKTNGTLWAWGRNDSGQLGDDSAWRPTPIEIYPDIP